MKLFANIINIKSTKKGIYPGDKSGESIIITQEGSAEKGETSQQYGQAGFISNPPANVKGIRLRIGSIDICIGAFNYGVAFPENPGETKVYSTDADGVEKATQYLDKDGNQIFNSGTDYMVAYEDLVTQFNELKGVVNSHTHIYNPGPSAPIATATALPQSAADITATKVPTMRIP